MLYKLSQLMRIFPPNISLETTCILVHGTGGHYVMAKVGVLHRQGIDADTSHVRVRMGFSTCVQPDGSVRRECVVDLLKCVNHCRNLPL